MWAENWLLAGATIEFSTEALVIALLALGGLIGGA